MSKLKRQLFSMVLQRQQLADALAGYMYIAQLGLKRRAKLAAGLADLLMNPRPWGLALLFPPRLIPLATWRGSPSCRIRQLHAQPGIVLF